jgi:hypothetical protein
MSASPSIVFLATPCYGGQVHMIYTQSLLALQPACATRGVGLVLDLGGGEALIGRARAGMMMRFLASPATHLLFADADVGFEPEDVFRLLAARRDVIGGLYPRKRLDRAALDRSVADEEPNPFARAMRLEAEPLPPDQVARSGELYTVAATGTGFLMISRAAAQRMVDGYPQLRAGLGDVHGSSVTAATMVFDSFVEPETGVYLNDYGAFCRRWRDLGGQVWVDPGCRIAHLSEITLFAAQLG